MDRILENKNFAHIYLEDALVDTKNVKQILLHFPNASIIPIRHYKDVFNRRHQSYMLQHQSQNLILAEKHGTLVYPGAPVCQSFGNRWFYYTSCVMNCVFDCEYCYLKGMYPSGNLVLFLNLEDIFKEVEALLREHPVYLSVSYDTDLLAIESFTGFVRRWTEFVAAHPDLTIEIRTKAAPELLPAGLVPSDRSIFALTLSPDAVVSQYEHKTPALASRLSFAEKLLDACFPVRLCFDPMLYYPGWRDGYSAMVDTVFKRLSPDSIRDVSVGSFRLSEEYLKVMRRNMPSSAVVQYPFVADHGYYQYPPARMEEMETFLVDKLSPYIGKEKIFRWKEQ
jgi:spore photoproduct lyase